MKVKKLKDILDENQDISVIEQGEDNWITRYKLAKTNTICERYGERKIVKIGCCVGNVLEIEIESYWKSLR
jgi:poly(3-hydroxyalkanoate) synthetase